QPLEMGPPVGRPIQYRVSGPQIDKVREYAMGLAGVLDGNPNIGDIVYDWNEPGRCSRSTSPRTRRASSGFPPRTWRRS
ncbi:hypothetical protein, partial [Pseudomonas aeruginosa]|uniref:hypothetical protein n=1 Tax=Pseudomonas aeruginosa TaxID=287 RepID=UPI003D29FD6E